MPLIALTGGIASGKSTIAARLAAHGAVIVDADALVREIQAPGSPVLDQIATTFGADVIVGDGSPDRAMLGRHVFGHPEKLAALNAIVHPAVRARSQELFDEARSHDPDAVIVYDVPLLVEARGDDQWDLVVVAHAPAPVRVERLVTERGMSLHDARARIASQVSDDDRLAIADVVIDTAGTLADTQAQVDALWERLQPRA